VPNLPPDPLTGEERTWLQMYQDRLDVAAQQSTLADEAFKNFMNGVPDPR